MIEENGTRFVVLWGEDGGQKLDPLIYRNISEQIQNMNPPSSKIPPYGVFAQKPMQAAWWFFFAGDRFPQHKRPREWCKQPNCASRIYGCVLGAIHTVSFQFLEKIASALNEPKNDLECYDVKGTPTMQLLPTSPKFHCVLLYIIARFPLMRSLVSAYRAPHG